MAFRNSRINVYDSTNFAELFEIKNEVGKVSLNSEAVQEVNATNIVFNKTDGLGAVIDTVPDVVAAINSGASAITQEIADRTAADTTLQVNIDAEATAREAADDNLQAIITAEADTRLNADNTLQTNIDVEKGRIDGILAGADVNLDTFTELVTFINGLDATQLALITTLQTDYTALRVDYDNLRAEFDAAFPDA